MWEHFAKHFEDGRRKPHGRQDRSGTLQHTTQHTRHSTTQAVFDQMLTSLPPQRLHPDPLSRLPASLCRSLCRQALPQGQLPHHRAPYQLPHDARSQQRKEADGRPHCRPRLRDRQSSPHVSQDAVPSPPSAPPRTHARAHSPLTLRTIGSPDDRPEPHPDRCRRHRQLWTP